MKLPVRLLALMFSICMLFCLLSPAAAAAEEPETFQLTQEERAYVQAHGTFKVGYVQDRVPISFRDANGELGGISRSIFDRIQQISGLTFEYVALPGGDVTYEYLLTEGFDLITSVEFNSENKKANGILMSDPYLSGRKVVVARQDLRFDPNASLRVAISSGSQTIKKVLNNTFPNFIIENYPSTNDCFDVVKSGEVDLTIQNQHVTEYWLHKPTYEKLKAMPVLGMEDQLCFSAIVAFGDWDGPSPEEGNLLIGILDKAIASLTEDEIASYTIQGVMDNQYSYTFGDFVYRYRFTIVLLSIAVVVIIVFSVVLFRLRVRALADQSDAKARDQFLSTMSHEIRTPLNGLIGLNYLMSQKLDDPQKLREYLEQSDSTAHYLLTLVNDILDTSRLQEHHLELEEKPVDLELLVSTVTAIVGRAMADKRLDFQTDCKLPYPCVAGDDVRIQQVVLNLLDNARKFTPEGGHVKLTARQHLTPEGTVSTRFEIQDDGRGMSEEFQQHVFDTFAQELDTISRGNQGTGLGLPISRSLSKLMGGDLTFTSVKGKGSTFCFEFPAKQTELPPERERSGSQAAGAKILVAEDNELNGEIMLELLEEEGYEAVWARDGKEAYETFAKSQPGTYGVILMDLLMPEMDGFQSAAAIRALNRPDAASVCIIACSANSFAQDRKKAAESGMDDFLSKPIDVGELIKKLKEREKKAEPPEQK